MRCLVASGPLALMKKICYRAGLSSDAGWASAKIVERRRLRNPCETRAASRGAERTVEERLAPRAGADRGFVNRAGRKPDAKGERRHERCRRARKKDRGGASRGGSRQSRRQRQLHR